MMKKIKFNKSSRLRPSKNHFQSLVRSIIAQQLSNKVASIIYERFKNLWPKKKFPSPQEVLKITEDKLRQVGLSKNKIMSIKDLAQKFLDKTINHKVFSSMSDKQIIEHLITVRGIGVWTAQMFLIFSLNRPNVLPTGDLAIKKGFAKAFALPKLPTEKEMFILAEAYVGEWTAFSLYLWSLMDEKGEV